MSATPRINPIAHTTTSAPYEIEQFFTNCFGDDAGYLALKYGKASAGAKRTYPHTRFYLMPAQRTEAAQDAHTFAQQGYDVTYSASLYSTTKIGKAHALPAAFIAGDDVHLARSPIQPSYVIYTSAQKPPQAIILVDQKLASQEREQYARGFAITAGADMSGWDCTQMLRVPFTYNYKHDQRQYITLSGTRKRVEVDAVRLAFGTAVAAIPPRTHYIRRAEDEVRRTRCDFDPRAEYDAVGVPQRLEPQAYTRKLWNYSRKSAERVGGDNLRSGACYQLVRGLLFKYSPYETLALMMDHGGWGRLRDMGDKWYELDIICCIGKVLEKYTPCSISGGDKKSLAVPDATKRPRGRPVERMEFAGKVISKTAAAVADALAGTATGTSSITTNTELAAITGKSERTVQRALDELEEAGLITRRQTKSGRVIDFPIRHMTENIQPLNNDHARDQDTPPVICQVEEAVDAAPVCDASPELEAVDVLPATPREAVSWAFAVVRAQLDQDGGRMSFAKIRDWIREQSPDAPWTDTALKRFYAAALEHEKKQHSIGFLAELRAMTMDGLLKHRDNLDRRIGTPKKGEKRSRKQLLADRCTVDRVIREKLAEIEAAQPAADTAQAQRAPSYQPQTSVRPMLYQDADRGDTLGGVSFQLGMQVQSSTQQYDPFRPVATNYMANRQRRMRVGGEGRCGLAWHADTGAADLERSEAVVR